MDQFKNLSLVCDICGKEGAKVRHVSRSYGNSSLSIWWTDPICFSNVSTTNKDKFVASFLTPQKSNALSSVTGVIIVFTLLHFHHQNLCKVLALDK